MNDPAQSVRHAGEAALRIRIEHGFDVETAARSASIEPERLEAFEDGDEALTFEELDRLAAAFGVTTNEFFGARWTPLQNYAAG